MTAVHPYADDPGPDEAEQVTRDMVAAGYVGRHRAGEDGQPLLDEHSINDLAAARVALWLGQREHHDSYEQAALLRLHYRLRDWVLVHRAIRLGEAQIDAAAQVQLALMRLEKAQTVADMFPGSGAA